MKNILTLILGLQFLILLSLSYCQEEVLDSPLIEIFTLVSDTNDYAEINYNLSPVGKAWEVKMIKLDSITYSISDSESVNGGVVYPLVNASYNNYTGFNYIITGDHNYPEFGFGFYKLKTSSNKYLYLDYRDTRYTWYSYCDEHCSDIWVNYDVNKDSIYIKNDGDGPWGKGVQTGSIFRIWDLKNQGTPVTVGVTNFWANSLIILNDKTHTYLIWSSYPDTVNNIRSYKVYKSKNSSGFTLLATVSSNTLEYTDYSELLFNGVGFPNKIKYYVKAVFVNNQVSEASNIVSALTNQPINKESTPPPPPAA